MRFRINYVKGNPETAKYGEDEVIPKDHIYFYNFYNQFFMAASFEDAIQIADDMLNKRFNEDYPKLTDWEWFHESDLCEGYQKTLTETEFWIEVSLQNIEVTHGE